LLERQQPTIGNYPRSVATTWALNFSEVEESPASSDLLRLSAFLAPEDIPLDLLAPGLAQLDGSLAQAVTGFKEDPLVLDEVVAPLLRYSLVQRLPDSHAYSLHRLTQAVIRQNLGPETEREWAERALLALDWVFPEPEVPVWPICQRLISHAQICAAWVRKWNIQSDRAALLLHKAAFYLGERAQYAEAEPLYRRALSIREKVLGPEHPDTATILDNLAELYRQQGRYAEAENLELKKK
jgi:tetratricopeptide (TPR) repeat protein